MPEFGRTSIARLNTCHPLIQLVARKVIKTYDITVVCGWRDKESQIVAFQTGKSTVSWPKSKHNNMFENKPYSLAIDLAPWINNGIPWNDIGEFKHMAGRVLQAAEDLGIDLEWGGEWLSIKDYPHFQLIGITT